MKRFIASATLPFTFWGISDIFYWMRVIEETLSPIIA